MFWQRIESAPKDGTRVFLLLKKMKEEVVVGAYFSELADAWIFDIGCSADYCDPTFWAPMPRLCKSPYKNPCTCCLADERCQFYNNDEPNPELEALFLPRDQWPKP